MDFLYFTKLLHHNFYVTQQYYIKQTLHYGGDKQKMFWSKTGMKQI